MSTQFPHASQARYLSRRHEELPELKSAYESGDLEAIRDAGHRWKGSGESYGFPDLSAIGARLETAAEKKDAGAVRALLNEYEAWLKAHPVDTTGLH